MKRLGSGILVVAAIAYGPLARAAIVGPNVYTDGGSDNGGTRLNIDVTAPVTLPAGTYQIDSATYRVATITLGTAPNQTQTNGDAQPFLATVTGTPGSGTETYTVVAVGADFPFAAPGTQTIPVGAASQFTLNSSTTLYAGFTSSANTTVTTDAGGLAVPGNDAHFAPGGLVVPGNTRAEFNSANNNAANGANGVYELSRHYDFALTVNAVPEPASAAMLGLGALGLLRRRSR